MPENETWLAGFVAGILFCGSTNSELITRLRREVRLHQERDSGDDGEFQAVEGLINDS